MSGLSAIARAAAVAALSAVLGGCAYTVVYPIDANNRTAQGIRYYEVKPLLVVTKETADIKFVPNPDKAYAVQFGAFLAKNDFSIDLEGGMLKKLGSNQDTSAGVADLLKQAATKFLPITALESKGAEAPVVAIYEFVFRDGELVRLKRVPLG